VTRRWRARALGIAAVVVVAVAAGIAGLTTSAAGRSPRPCTSGTSSCASVVTKAPGPTVPSSTTVPSTVARPRPRRALHPRVDDGSLGNEATRVACTLLSRAQISKEFGTPVGEATPAYPYCQWLVGENSYLALSVEPHTSFDTATQYVDTLVTVTGLGQQAIIANNRYLYFTEGSTSYWLLWQTPGDFTALNTAQLVALGHDVLARGLPKGPVGLPPAVPPGPPIYFAGDSTVAGPEWAWWAYHENSTTTRTLAEYQVGTGLVRGSFFDWPMHLLAVVAARRPKLVIWMGSANDGQDIILDGSDQPVGSRLWDAAYAKTVASTMQELLDEGCRVLWIGEPAMQDPELNSSMQVLDAIYSEEAAQHPGIVFYNPGAVLNGPHGSYAGSLVIHGQLTPVRLDGIHLNQAGSVVLADAIAPIVDRMLDVGQKRPVRREAVQLQRS
jgi:lysophospholipase L1-like esterase